MLMKKPRHLQRAMASSEVNGLDAGRADTLLQIIWRRRTTVMAVAVVCIFGAVVYLLAARKVYTSTSRIYVQQATPRVLSDQQTGQHISDAFFYTQAELLGSTPIISAALEQLNVGSMGIFTNVDNPQQFLKRNLA